MNIFSEIFVCKQDDIKERSKGYPTFLHNTTGNQPDKKDE